MTEAAQSSATYAITGGNALYGRIRISGSKNGADYAIAAALLTADDVILHNVPDILDVTQMAEILAHLGARIVRIGEGSLKITCADLTGWDVPPRMAVRLRASFLAMGPLLARTGRASCPPPGGDAIGIRPLDVHLAGFRVLGAAVTNDGEIFDVHREGPLRGGRLVLDYPSVMGTLNVMLAATLAEGETIIINAAISGSLAALMMIVSPSARRSSSTPRANRRSRIWP